VTVTGWRKSSYSMSNGACGEVSTAHGAVLVRDSKLGDSSPVLTFGGGEWAAFTTRIRKGTAVGDGD